MIVVPMFFYWNDAVFLPAYALALVLLMLGYRSWLHWRHRPQPTAPHTPPPLADPYAVAYLRGGPTETVRTAVFALLCRGAVTPTSKKNLQRVPGFDAFKLRSLEAQVLTGFVTPRSAEGLLWESSRIREIAVDYEMRLRDAGLLTRRGVFERRVYLVLIAAMLLVMVVRSIVSVQMGYPGYVPVIGATLLACLFLRPFWRSQTPRGRRALAQQKEAHQRWVSHAGSVDDAIWVAAAWGVASLSSLAYPMAMYAMPAMGRHRSGGADGSASSSSSDTSSGDSWCSSDSSSGDSGSCGDGGGGSSSD